MISDGIFINASMIKRPLKPIDAIIIPVTVLPVKYPIFVMLKSKEN